nr:hypothetical protein [Bradyrhizobium sp. CCBAU 51765]
MLVLVAEDIEWITRARSGRWPECTADMQGWRLKRWETRIERH